MRNMRGPRGTGASGPGGRSKRKGRIRLSYTQLAVLALLLLGLGFAVGRLMGGSPEYKGLGEPAELKPNAYDPEKFTQTKSTGRLAYEDGEYTSCDVIDVSYVQQNINWEKVASEGIDMAMIRLGFRGYKTGLLQTDEFFEQNTAGAEAAGVEYGVYFFSQAVSTEEAIEEARFVIENLKKKKLKGPVAFDMEPITGADRVTHLTVDEKTEIADAFCRTVEKEGYEAMIYGNPGWFTNNLDLTRLTDYPVWLAHYTHTTNWPYEFSMWQYSCTGKVKGIKGDVDLSIKFIKR